MPTTKTYPLSDKNALRLANLLNLAQKLQYEMEKVQAADIAVKREVIEHLGLSLEGRYHFDTDKCEVTEFIDEEPKPDVTKKRKR